MFNNIEDVKKFIEWAKSKKLRSFKSEQVQFEISDLGLVEDLQVSNEKEITDFENKTLVDTEKMSQEEYDELLFWSTNK